MSPPSFSRLLLVPVALLVLLAFVLAALLGTVFGERATHFLVSQLVAQAGATVHERLQHHLQEPQRLIQRNVQAFADGEITAADLFHAPEDWFFPQQTQFPGIDDVYFADAQGAIAGIDKTAGQWVLKLTTEFPQRRFYALDAHGRRWGEVAAGSYDARTRDWYRLARAAGQPVWSAPYPLQNKQSMGQPALGITLAAPVFDRQRQFQGVFGVNLTLRTLSGFLREHPVGPDSVSYIVDAAGRLVAASPADMPLIGPRTDGPPQRLLASQAADARVAASMLALGPEVRRDAHPAEALTSTIGGRPHWIYVQRFSQAGLDWRVISVVNPQPFLVGVRTTAVATLLLGLLLLALLAWLVRRTTRRLSQPLRRLAEAVQAVGDGELGQTLPPMQGGREIHQLGQAFNRMSAALAVARRQLQDHAAGLERTVAERTAELSDVNHALQAALQRSDAASRAKSRFVADLSHEVRTPLHAMLSLAWLLREDPLTDAQRRRLDQIDLAGRHLGDVLGEVLELARIEALDNPLRPQPLSVAALLQQTAELMRDRAALRGQQLCIEVPDGLPRFLGDVTRLRQALLNLLSNAVKYADPGPVVLRLRVQGPLADDALLRFEVADSGPGLAAERQARLFRAFDAERADHADPQVPSSGLGLAITRSLVERMGGEVGVDSAPGRGSTFHFTVRLPCAQGAVEPMVDLEPALAALRQRHAGRPVLVVEDDPVSAEIAAALLAPTGLLVTTVDAPQHALDLTARLPWALILTDMQFSDADLDGLAMIRALRACPDRASTPVIVQTGQALAEDHARIRQAGIDHILTKPVAAADLYRTVLQVLDRGQVLPFAPPAQYDRVRG